MLFITLLFLGSAQLLINTITEDRNDFITNDYTKMKHKERKKKHGKRKVQKISEMVNKLSVTNSNHNFVTPCCKIF